jgi:hypothetical protein
MSTALLGFEKLLNLVFLSSVGGGGGAVGEFTSTKSAFSSGEGTIYRAKPLEMKIDPIRE